jgi:hypothetical protein
MKKMTITILLILLTMVCKAPEWKTLTIIRAESINPYETIVKAVTTVESRNGKYLFNEKENAVGWFGIRPIRLNDYNKRTGKNISHTACYNYEVGRMIFLYYASQFDYRDTKSICVGWNGKSKKNLYYKKIRKELSSINS